MNEITCPNCKEIFKIDPKGYAAILNQVHNNEFDKALKERLEKALELAEAKHKITLQDSLKEKDDELAKKDLIIKMKDEEIDLRKDMKAKLSTKMVGETLEAHCENNFEMLRHTGFKKASFQKDNNASSGSKGDYIYREFDNDGNEYISIMFEMKNEADLTSTKKKNEHFLSELDKDRVEKKCEYAVLVSLLEAESELYNTGIVDVSHAHQKMYVIRPQFFIPIITILRNAAQKTLEYKTELAVIKNEQIDVTKFIETLNKYNVDFKIKYDNVYTELEKAIAEIEKSIKNLQKVKTALISSKDSLDDANELTCNTTLKTLTDNNPTMKALLAEPLDKDKAGD